MGETLVSIKCKNVSYSDVQSLITNIFEDPEGESIKHQRHPEPSPTTSDVSIKNPRDRGWTSKGIQELKVKQIAGPTSRITKSVISDKNQSCFATEQKVKSKIKFLQSKETQPNLKPNQCDDTADIISFVNTIRPGKNPANQNGVYSKCVECRANTHWVRDCPDKAVQYVDIAPAILQTLNSECKSDAVISSKVSSTVGGWDWLNSYLDALSPSVKSQIKWSENPCISSFRKSGDTTSTHYIDLPVRLGSTKTWKIVRTQVIDRQVPLLLSRISFKRGQMRIDGQNNSATYGQVIKLGVTSTGYLTFSLSAHPFAYGVQPGGYLKSDQFSPAYSENMRITKYPDKD